MPTRSDNSSNPRAVVDEIASNLADDARRGVPRFQREGLPDARGIQEFVAQVAERVDRKPRRKIIPRKPIKRPTPPPIHRDLGTVDVNFATGEVRGRIVDPDPQPLPHPDPDVAVRLIELCRHPTWARRVLEICFFDPPNQPRKTRRERDELLFKLVQESVKEFGPYERATQNPPIR